VSLRECTIDSALFDIPAYCLPVAARSSVPRNGASYGVTFSEARLTPGDPVENYKKVHIHYVTDEMKFSI